jgi:hypothetical protein
MCIFESIWNISLENTNSPNYALENTNPPTVSGSYGNRSYITDNYTYPYLCLWRCGPMDKLK